MHGKTNIKFVLSVCNLNAVAMKIFDYLINCY